MSSISKDVLADIGEKRGFKFYRYEQDVIRFSKSIEDLKDRLEYLEWVIAVYNINYEQINIIYFDNDGIAKDQFADTITIEISVLTEYLTKMKIVKSDLNKSKLDVEPEPNETGNINGTLKIHKFKYNKRLNQFKVNDNVYCLNPKAKRATSILLDEAETEFPYMREDDILDQVNHMDEDKITTYKRLTDMFQSKDEKEFFKLVIKKKPGSRDQIYLDVLDLL